jgi:hypothetical protein
MTRRLVLVLFALVGLVAQAQAPSQGSGDPGRSSKSGVRERAPFNDSIRIADMKADLFFLASDDMQGRLTDTVGNHLAAEWVKSRFERMGLKPAMPDGSYFEPYDLVTATLGRRENSLALTDGASARRELAHATDFYAHRFSATASAVGPVVFAGFGITSPDRSHDDLKGGGIEGAVVLVLDHEPGENDPNSPFDGVVRAEAAGALRKALFAQARGAAGLLIVSDVHNHPDPEDFPRAARGYWPEQPRRIEAYTLAAWMEQVRIPVAQISVEAASALVRGTGRTLADLSKSAEIAHGVTPLALPGARAELATSVDRHIVPDRNVVAIVEGADPKLKDEFVIVCGHYDHDGMDGARVFNGADDDGSGTVGVVEIAEAYALAAQAGRRPRRSVLFAAWNSEERGLLGGWAYVEQPIHPLEKTVAVLNMDMIGRNEEVPEGQGNTGRFRGLDVQTSASNNNAINVIGTARSADMKTATTKANQPFGLDLKFRYDNNTSNLMRRSDHWPFLQKGVPALWFHTGLHPDYHTVNDRPERINYEKMEKIARMVHQMSWDLANADGRPRLDRVKTTTSASK